MQKYDMVDIEALKVTVQAMLDEVVYRTEHLPEFVDKLEFVFDELHGAVKEHDVELDVLDQTIDALIGEIKGKVDGLSDLAGQLSETVGEYHDAIDDAVLSTYGRGELRCRG